MRRSTVFGLFALLCSCAFHGDDDVVAHASLIKLSSNSVELEVKTTGNEPICISAADLSPYYGNLKIFGKNGKEIFRSNSVNRELQTYKEMDIADGVLIVVQNKNKKILISLSEFDSNNENIVRGYLEFSYSSCSSLFDDSRPVRSMRVSF